MPRQVLNERKVIDILNDFSHSDADATVTGPSKLDEILRFSDPSLCSRRPVTDVMFSPHDKELVLASYNASRPGYDAGAGAGGLVLLWHMGMSHTPQYTFTCDSPILSAKFAEDNPNIVVGAGFSGQIFMCVAKQSSLDFHLGPPNRHFREASSHSVACVVTHAHTLLPAVSTRWDTRQQHRQLPYQKTELSSDSHAHPIYSMAIRGSSGNNHSLVTASTDGLMCEWSLAQLFRPSKRSQLKYEERIKRGEGLEDVRITALEVAPRLPVLLSISLPHSHHVPPSLPQLGPMTTHKFQGREAQHSAIVGSESGHIYVADLDPRTDQRSGMQGKQSVQGRIDGHIGMITSMSYNPYRHHNPSKGLLLTAGVDWTTRLWAPFASPPSSSSASSSFSASASTAAATASSSPSISPSTSSSSLLSLAPTSPPTSSETSELAKFSGDYSCVSDVAWSPAHPALFGTVNAVGTLALWELTSIAGFEEPRVKVRGPCPCVHVCMRVYMCAVPPAPLTLVADCLCRAQQRIGERMEGIRHPSEGRNQHLPRSHRCPRLYTIRLFVHVPDRADGCHAYRIRLPVPCFPQSD